MGSRVMGSRVVGLHTMGSRLPIPINRSFSILTSPSGSRRAKSASHKIFLVACLAASVLTVTSHAHAAPELSKSKALLPVIEPAESSEGNFLAAVVAGSQRDTNSAAAYLREALRADPRNTELIERSFEAHLAGGNVEEAARLARQMLTRERNNSLARLTLAIELFLP